MLVGQRGRTKSVRGPQMAPGPQCGHPSVGIVPLMEAADFYPSCFLVKLFGLMDFCSYFQPVAVMRNHGNKILLISISKTRIAAELRLWGVENEAQWMQTGSWELLFHQSQQETGNLEWTSKWMNFKNSPRQFYLHYISQRNCRILSSTLTSLPDFLTKQPDGFTEVWQ